MVVTFIYNNTISNKRFACGTAKKNMSFKLSWYRQIASSEVTFGKSFVGRSWPKFSFLTSRKFKSILELPVMEAINKQNDRLGKLTELTKGYESLYDEIV